MKGWECPKCGKCFAPFVRECDWCGVIKDIGRLSDKYTQPQTGTAKCLACNGYHPLGVACPITKGQDGSDHVILSQVTAESLAEALKNKGGVEILKLSEGDTKGEGIV